MFKNNPSVNLLFLMAVILTSSCTERFYKVDDFPKLTKFDTHVHLSGSNTGIAEQAIADNFKLVSISVDLDEKPDIVQQFNYATFQKNKFPEHVYTITSFTLENWNSPTWEDEVIAKLKEDFERGALGIKIWKNIGMTYKDADGEFIMIDRPRFDKVINFVKQQGKMVIGHLGEPRNCWLPLDSMTVSSDKAYFKDHPQFHMYLHPEYPSYEEQLAARDRFLDRNPGLQFVGAHLASIEWSVDELAKRLDKYPNMAVDMAERICHWQYQSLTDREKVRDFIIKYQDQLIYGTDLYISDFADNSNVKNHAHKLWTKDWKYFVTDETMTAPQVNGSFQGLKLPKEVVDKIYYHNAVKWFNIKD